MLDNKTHYNKSIPLGYKQNNQYFVYNHINFDVAVAKPDPASEAFQVVGFAAEPLSTKNFDKVQQINRKSPEDIA